MSDILSAYADCVATLHEAALSPEHWPNALQASMRLFGASGIMLTDIDTRLGTPRAIRTAGHEPALLDAYAGHYARVDPTIAVGMAGSHGTVYHLREHFSERQMSVMEYFQDFLFAFGVADVMAAPIDYAPGGRLFVSLQRRTGEAHFDANYHPLLDRYIRQVNIVKQTESRLQAASADHDALARGLDAFAAAMFIVDASVRVRHHNRAADRLLAARKGVEVKSEHLRISHSPLDARLTHAVTSAAKPRANAAIFVMDVPEGRQLQVIVTPLHPAHALNQSWQQPLVLVIVSDTRQMAMAAAEMMRRLHGLTPAESRLVAELADGRTLNEIADLRLVSQATLRTQLKAAFSKTGTRRQVDLVRLVSVLAHVTGETIDDGPV